MAADIKAQSTASDQGNSELEVLPQQFVPVYLRRGHFMHKLGLSDDSQEFVDEAGIHYSIVFFGDPLKNKCYLIPVRFQHALSVPSPLRWHYHLNGLALDEVEVLDQLALLRRMNRAVWESCRNVDDFHDRRRTGRRALLRPVYAWADRTMPGQAVGAVTRKPGEFVPDDQAVDVTKETK